MNINALSPAMITLNQTLLEKQTKEPPLCQMCHKNPAEHSGLCGDCFEKVNEVKEEQKRGV